MAINTRETRLLLHLWPLTSDLWPYVSRCFTSGL